MTDKVMGRPKQLDQAVRVTITLDAQDIEYLKSVSENTSKAVRECISFCRHYTPETINEDANNG
jgi:hypothetical protein